MPKPLLLRRPSGFYVRFYVPARWRASLGLGRYLVRSLAGLDADSARLEAARLGYALAQVFSARKQGAGVSFTKRMDEQDDYLASLRRLEVETPEGFKFKTDGSARDHQQLRELLADMAARRPVQGLALPASSPPSPPARLGPLLSERIDLFLTQFKARKVSAGNVLDTAYTLRLLLGLVGDKPLAEVAAPDMDILMDALANLPPNASKDRVLRDLSPQEVIAKAKREGIRALSQGAVCGLLEGLPQGLEASEDDGGPASGQEAKKGVRCPGGLTSDYVGEKVYFFQGMRPGSSRARKATMSFRPW